MRSKLINGYCERVFCIFVILTILTLCVEQTLTSISVSSGSFEQIRRIFIPVPEGRLRQLDDVYITHYLNNSTNSKEYRFMNIKELLTSQSFDLQKPTVIYCHGWVELATDKNIQDFMGAYTKNGGYNALLLDWSNFAFGGYILASLSIKTVAVGTADAIMNLLDGGMALASLHLVGHSLGAELLAQVCRELSLKGVRIRRLTCLDAAYPGFHPAILGEPVSPSVAEFVDAIHTDGGKYGTPAAVGHVDFWPNGGTGKQPGCPSFTIPITAEDLCSHWRSHQIWAESLLGGRFLARRCSNYNSFLHGKCSNTTMVSMGVDVDTNLRGNFYLKTAASEPFALGEKGAK